MLKRLVKQRKGKVSKTGRILSENGRLELFAKNRRFQTKTGELESGNCAYTTQKNTHTRINTGACRSARTSKPVYCKISVRLQDLTKIQHTQWRNTNLEGSYKYDTAGYENANFLCPESVPRIIEVFHCTNILISTNNRWMHFSAIKFQNFLGEHAPR